MNPCSQIQDIPPNAVFYHITRRAAPQDLITAQSCFLFIAGETSASQITPDLPDCAL